MGVHARLPEFERQDVIGCVTEVMRPGPPAYGDGADLPFVSIANLSFSSILLNT